MLQKGRKEREIILNLHLNIYIKSILDISSASVDFIHF